jgi:hypothetical protein
VRGHLGFPILTAAAVAFSACLWFAPPSNEAARIQPAPIFAVMDDQARPELVLRAGYHVQKRTIWLDRDSKHFDDLNPTYLGQLKSYFADAERLNQSVSGGFKVIIELWPSLASNVPLNPARQRNYCDVAVDIVNQYPGLIEGVEVGVEPNNHRFWKVQFGPSGRNASAAPYTSWLGRCYDKIKAANPDVLVIGGSLASWGNDNPHKGRWANTSPALFIQKMCESYKTSGRDRPLMDWFDMHSYQSSSTAPPDTQHPAPSTTITIGDQAKLDDLLGCFDGTAQPMPRKWWGEAAYQTEIPAGQAYRYTGKEPPGGGLISAVLQGQYIAESIRMAFCQGSAGYVQFHVLDEPNLGGWQSGTYYAYSRKQPPRSTQSASELPKRSASIVRDAVRAAEDGSIECG